MEILFQGEKIIQSTPENQSVTPKLRAFFYHIFDRTIEVIGHDGFPQSAHTEEAREDQDNQTTDENESVSATLHERCQRSYRIFFTQAPGLIENEGNQCESKVFPSAVDNQIEIRIWFRNGLPQ